MRKELESGLKDQSNTITAKGKLRRALTLTENALKQLK
jgi:hypothetical protein